MSPSFVTRLLALALVLFVGIASAVLLWDGIAGLAPGGATAHAWRARARLAVGVLGFAAALWIALGMLTHAH